ncbi:MAG: type II toxin-antitoxin system PemK/MazF family toxin [Actinobacteria bacterium]|nr:type II toxin-antitoxin system PemK/MazF family toxin [Actinomycetota bacterium]
MLNSGDVVELDLGLPLGREAGLRRPAVVTTAQRILEASPSVIQVVPLTTTIRGFGSEILIEPDQSNGLERPAAAQCQHVRAVSAGRVDRVLGNVGAVALARIRETLGLILDIPS